MKLSIFLMLSLILIPAFMSCIKVTKIIYDETISVMITTSPNTSGATRYAQVTVYEGDRGNYIKVYQQ